MIKERLEIGLRHLLQQKEPGFFMCCLHSFLGVFSQGFRAVVCLKNALYDRGILSSHRCGVPVISIGNVVAGGTGKTPVTLLLAKSLSSFCKVGILLRGYRSPAEKRKNPLLLSRGNGPLLSADQCGDEAYLLASRVQEAIVVVGRDRALSAKKAIETGAQLILLDDGMQHRKLFRDIEIAVVNGNNPLGGNHFLPRGFLRDEPKRLSKADLIVINGNGSLTGNVPTVCVYHTPVAVMDIEGKEVRLEKEAPIALFCGIANPLRFVETVKSLGVRIVTTHFLADHVGLMGEKLIRFALKAKKEGAQCLVCTEKDKVKLSLAEKNKVPLPIFWVKSELIIQNNHEAFDRLIERIKQLVKR